MKKLINLFILLLMLTTTSLISCTKDSIGKGGRHSSGSSGDNIESDIIPRGEELYNQIADELYNYLKGHDGATIGDIQELLEKYSTLVTSEVRNNILYLKIDGQYDFMCDPYQVTGELEPEEDNNLQEDIEIVEREIQEALYPNGATARSRSANIEGSEMYTRASNGNSDLLDKKQVMIWNPWRISNVKNLMKNNIKDIKGLKVKSFYFEGLSDLMNMDQYDVVFLCCHGDPDGTIWIPWTKNSNGDPSFGEKVSALFGSGQITVEGRSVTNDELRKYLPSNLSKTVIWTAICFGDVSFLKQLAIGRGCPAYSGADNFCTIDLPDNYFGLFLYTLYQGARVGAAADYALPENYIGGQRASNAVCRGRGTHFSVPYYKSKGNLVVDRKYLELYDNPEIINIISDNKVEIEMPVSGNYNFHCYNSNITGAVLVEAMSSMDNQPHACFIGPNDWSSSITNRTFASTRNPSSGIPAGFWIRNKETKEVLEIPFSNSTVKKYENEYTPTFFPKNSNEPKMIARIEVLGITDSLKAGTYEYRTYLEIDGKKEYSDKTYEFEVKRINKVVPEWLLKMMAPYIPIYEGDNPPVVEGSYLLSPQTLLYDSGNSYSPGRKFADNMLFFTGQDEVEDTINYVGFEINNNGEIISEKYGEGAFISGEGNNFSIFFNIVGETHYSDGDAYLKEALIISGTKTPTGIKDLYYAFAMVDKYDPYNHLMDIGVFRVFVDGDGIAYAIDLNDESRTRGYNTIQAPLLPSDADNDHSFTYQRGIPFYEWKNRIDMLKRIRIVNGKKVMK